MVRGALEQGVMDSSYKATAEAGQVVNLPGGMVHSGKLSEFGADQFDVFWPVRTDYVEKAQKQQALREQVLAADAKPQKIADGFTFAEGATWLNGKLYFSDMWFKDHKAGDWTGSPAKPADRDEPDGDGEPARRSGRTCRSSRGRGDAARPQPDRAAAPAPRARGRGRCLARRGERRSRRLPARRVEDHLVPVIAAPGLGFVEHV